MPIPNRIKHFEQWLDDTADEVDSRDQPAYETGKALVFFYREIVRIATTNEGTWADVAELFSDPRIVPALDDE